MTPVCNPTGNKTTYLDLLSLFIQSVVLLHLGLAALDHSNLFQYLSLFGQGNTVDGSLAFQCTAIDTIKI
jgi:hypothetical protein